MVTVELNDSVVRHEMGRVGAWFPPLEAGPSTQAVFASGCVFLKFTGHKDPEGNGLMMLQFDPHSAADLALVMAAIAKVMPDDARLGEIAARLPTVVDH
jgi:hypothetical protein